MFRKLIFNKTLIFILIFTILFNFITIPKKLYAEAITMSYGLYVFLQAAYAAGLTYIVADRVTEDGMKLYQEWQKFNENKPDPSDGNDQKNAIANLLGLGLLDSFGNLVDSVKDFFKSLGAKEGENLVPLVPFISDGQQMGNITIPNPYYNDKSISSDNMNFSVANIIYNSVSYSLVVEKGYLRVYINGQKTNGRSVTSSRFTEWDTLTFKYTIYQENRIVISFHNIFNGAFFVDDYISIPDYKPEIIYSYEYNIINNSYILTDDKKDVKEMSPNIDILPEEKLETIVTPEGYYKKYIGDDLVDDYIESIPKNFPGDLFEKTPGKFVETDYGIVFVPEGSPIPSPNPNPDPNPDPDPDPNPDPDPDPNPDPNPEYPDTFPTDPYPDIVEEDVEIPKGLGKIIALLKELVNWSSRIFNKEEIDKDLEPDKPGLFEIPGDLELDLDPLKNLAIVEKFPFSLPWDLKNAVNLLVSPAEPPAWEVPIYKEKITIDLSEFESLATISRSFFTILFIISLVIATRRFIGGA